MADEALQLFLHDRDRRFFLGHVIKHGSFEESIAFLLTQLGISRFWFTDREKCFHFKRFDQFRYFLEEDKFPLIWNKYNFVLCLYVE